MLNHKGNFPDSKVHGATMGPIWGRQAPGGPHVGHVNLAIWVGISKLPEWKQDSFAPLWIKYSVKYAYDLALLDFILFM